MKKNNARMTGLVLVAALALGAAPARAWWPEGHSILAELARRGYLTICIDAMNFGERDLSCSPAPTDVRSSYQNAVGLTHEYAED